MISDASVWAHPILHRLSSREDIASIKRRATPKLFRTRRLANGQIVRTRAGPAVEAKFREVRESIAESRRRRGSLASIRNPSPSEDEMDHDERRHIPEEMMSENAPPTPPNMGNHTSFSSMTPAVPRVRHSSGSLSDNRSRLADIQEGKVADDVTSSYCSHRLSHASLAGGLPMTPVTASSHAPGLDMDHQDTQRTRRTMSNVSMNGAQLSSRCQSSQMATDLLTPMISMSSPRTATDRQLQSCPASIHTTPIPAHVSLGQARVSQLAPIQPSPFSMPVGNQPITDITRSGLIHIDTAEMQVGTNEGPPMLDTGFHMHMSPDNRNESGFNPTTWSADVYQTSATNSQAQCIFQDPWSGLGSSSPSRMMASVEPTSLIGQEQVEASPAIWTSTSIPQSAQDYTPRSSVYDVNIPLTIDPRWVSPRGSMPSTPAETPGQLSSGSMELKMPVYTSPVDAIHPNGQSFEIDDSLVMVQTEDGNYQYQFSSRQDGTGHAIQPLRAQQARLATQSYPPGQAARKRMGATSTISLFA
ncbi:hypothetical protein BD324DRAFT_636020 [Kockovaella imperatae]|uniref:Uncharacterized protein n=1 Tax=Kockovaella imperatae TaxID=4999 RepID=A0A1Y1U8X2_9TREE|nr:hypothetical protein BD324DRAFT_636020 [Kockovaella imperatae]ORX34462.1 hypothetical protein BD324DRAFT_636020 [Kockovaella imperatae]